MSYEILPIFDATELTSLFDNTGVASGVDCIATEQAYQSISTLWSPIESIVFTTSLIPVVNEFTGQQSTFGDSNDATPTSSANAFSPIITDIALPLSSPADYRGFIEYVPSAEYRIVSLSSSRQEIKNIDVQVYWKNRLDGALIPVQMPPSSTISIKMMFRKKNMGY